MKGISGKINWGREDVINAMPCAILIRLLGRARKILPYIPLGLARYRRDYSKRERRLLPTSTFAFHGESTRKRKYVRF
jgi:hypothetical protein